MFTLTIGTTIIVIAIIALAEPEYLQIVKELVYQLVKYGYSNEKIVQIINLYD